MIVTDDSASETITLLYRSFKIALFRLLCISFRCASYHFQSINIWLKCSDILFSPLIHVFLFTSHLISSLPHFFLPFSIPSCTIYLTLHKYLLNSGFRWSLEEIRSTKIRVYSGCAADIGSVPCSENQTSRREGRGAVWHRLTHRASGHPQGIQQHCWWTVRYVRYLTQLTSQDDF